MDTNFQWTSWVFPLRTKSLLSLTLPKKEKESWLKLLLFEKTTLMLGLTTAEKKHIPLSAPNSYKPQDDLFALQTFPSRRGGYRS